MKKEEINELNWLGLAVGGYKKEFHEIHFEDDLAVATDGFRLHLAETEANLGESVKGYPNYSKSLPLPSQASIRIIINRQYLLDALAVEADSVVLSIQSDENTFTKRPLLIQYNNQNKIACIMPTVSYHDKFWFPSNVEEKAKLNEVIKSLPNLNLTYEQKKRIALIIDEGGSDE